MKHQEKSWVVEKNIVIPQNIGEVLGSGWDENDANRAKLTNSAKKYTSTQRITLGILVFTYICKGACISLLPPLFPREAESKGITATEYGLVFTAYECGVFVGALIMGKLVARVQPKYVLNAGVFTYGATYVLLGTLDLVPSGSPFLASALTIRIIEGFGCSAIKTAAYSILASQFRETTSTNFGLLEIGLGIGYIVGATVGGYLFDLGGYGLPFYVVGVLELFDALVIFFVLPKSEESVRRKADFFKFWFHPDVMIYFLVVFTTRNYTGFNNANLEPHMRQFNLPGVWLGSIYALMGSMFAVGAGLWGWLSDKKFGNKSLILVASCFIIAAQNLVGPLPLYKMEPILGVIIFSLVLTGIGAGGKLVCSFSGALEDTISRGFPRNFNTYGLVSSAFIIAESVGSGVGPSLGGFLVDNFGFRMSTVVLLAVEVLLIVTVAIYTCTRKPSESTTENEEKKPIVANNSQPQSYS